MTGCMMHFNEKSFDGTVKQINPRSVISTKKKKKVRLLTQTRAFFQTPQYISTVFWSSTLRSGLENSELFGILLVMSYKWGLSKTCAVISSQRPANVCTTQWQQCALQPSLGAQRRKRDCGKGRRKERRVSAGLHQLSGGRVLCRRASLP